MAHQDEHILDSAIQEHKQKERQAGRWCPPVSLRPGEDRTGMHSTSPQLWPVSLPTLRAASVLAGSSYLVQRALPPSPKSGPNSPSVLTASPLNSQGSSSPSSGTSVLPATLSSPTQSYPLVAMKSSFAPPSFVLQDRLWNIPYSPSVECQHKHSCHLQEKVTTAL